MHKVPFSLMASISIFLLLLSTFSIVTAQQRYSNISLDSSLSPNTNLTSWLSPSGQFAFGFYPIYQDSFIIAIWFTRIPEKTIIWIANEDNPQVPNNVILHLTSNGGLVLRSSQGNERSITDISESASSASLLDSGNFVIYNSDLKIIWQSFDYPTNTIVQGQRLVAGRELMQQTPDTAPYSYWASAQLKMGFYDQTCPKAEKIVLDYVKKHIPNTPTLAAAFLRLHFHDCFVRGCDASVLLNDTSSNQAEKNAAPNPSFRGFNFIDRVKSLLEAECPGVVSCADLLSLVARDSVVTIGGPFWKVPTGRRDGTISNASEAVSNLPSKSFNFTTLQSTFARKGLDVKDLVLLSGAHTIGISHCSKVSNRLYNFTGVGDQDPSLDTEYAANLRANKCKTPNDNTTILEMDPGSFRTFDLSYYRNLVKRRGLFVSDAALTTDTTSRSLVNQLLQGTLSDFFTEFANSMEKMGQIEVKTGTSGQIRKHCAFVNS